MNHKDLAALCQKSYGSTFQDGAQEISEGGQTCFVIHRDDQAVVVFRGSANLGDFLADIDCHKIEAHLTGLVHEGFWRTWNMLHGQVLAAVAGRPATLTGHSLGGAHATLAAMELPFVNEVVTFGCPRVGDKDFANAYFNAFNRKTTRYVNYVDPVPFTPPWLKGFRHATPATWFNGQTWGKLTACQWVKNAVRLFKTDKTEFIKDHFMNSYVQAMSTNPN